MHRQTQSYIIAKWNVHASANIFQCGQSFKAYMHPASRAKYKKCMNPWICMGFSEDASMFVFALPTDENANLHPPHQNKLRQTQIASYVAVFIQMTVNRGEKPPLFTVYQQSKLGQNGMSPVMRFHTLIGAYLVTSLSLTFAINCRALVFSGSIIAIKNKRIPVPSLVVTLLSLHPTDSESTVGRL